MTNDIAGKLTPEQIERAAIALWEATDTKRAQPHEDLWRDVPEVAKGEWRQWAQAAAPHLQFPIAEPTEEEIVAANQCIIAWTGLRCEAAVIELLKRFVNLRNSPPKPDPRREVISRSLRSVNFDEMTIREITDLLLKALDEMEAAK